MYHPSAAITAFNRFSILLTDLYIESQFVYKYVVSPNPTLSLTAPCGGVIGKTSSGVAYESHIRGGDGRALAVGGANGEKWVR